MDKNISLEKVEEVLSQGSYFNVRGSIELDRGIRHIYQLINDSYILYNNGSYSTSVFLSITAIEEVAKLYTGLYIKKTCMKTSKSDPLRNHKKKHTLGTNCTISMGNRLQESIGTEMMYKIFEDAQKGNLIELRESSLYCDCVNEEFVTPGERISHHQSRAMLLFAIEAFDDNLVGYTNYSMEISSCTDKIFCDLASSFKTVKN